MMLVWKIESFQRIGGDNKANHAGLEIDYGIDWKTADEFEDFDGSRVEQTIPFTWNCSQGTVAREQR